MKANITATATMAPNSRIMVMLVLTSERKPTEVVTLVNMMAEPIFWTVMRIASRLSRPRISSSWNFTRICIESATPIIRTSVGTI